MKLNIVNAISFLSLCEHFGIKAFMKLNIEAARNISAFFQKIKIKNVSLSRSVICQTLPRLRLPNQSVATCRQGQ